MYVILHLSKGTPFETADQGQSRFRTVWEQLDYGVQYSPTKKFLTVVPIILWVLLCLLMVFAVMSPTYFPFCLQLLPGQFLHKIRAATLRSEHSLATDSAPPQTAHVSWRTDLWHQQVLMLQLSLSFPLHTWLHHMQIPASVPWHGGESSFTSSLSAPQAFECIWTNFVFLLILWNICSCHWFHTSFIGIAWNRLLSA